MSVLGESHLSDLRGGFGGGGFSLGHAPPLLPIPLWRSPSLSTWCTGSTCPCSSFSRPYIMTDLFDYTSTSPPAMWPAWYSKFSGDPLYKNHSLLHIRESPNKELPTKLSKHDRLKDRQELSQTLNFDKDHASKLNSKKCAGTQTQISSIITEMHTNGERHSTAEAYAQHAMISSNTSQGPMCSTPPPHYVAMDTHDISHDVPLNLSLSNSSFPSVSQSLQHRPSVITSTSVAGPGMRLPYTPSHSPGGHDVISVGCDPAIEEHFRRSLGRDYSDYMAPPPKAALPPPPPLVATPPSPPVAATPTPATSAKVKMNTEVSITGTVDDHFAKSLGNTTWSQIKAQSDPIQDFLTGSVDDHFTKALGDTWLRIKSEKEGMCSDSSDSSPPPQRHSSMLST
ncbi:hypothetical protein ScPMuIL_008710 [Solemya velum]